MRCATSFALIASIFSCASSGVLADQSERSFSVLGMNIGSYVTEATRYTRFGARDFFISGERSLGLPDQTVTGWAYHRQALDLGRWFFLHYTRDYRDARAIVDVTQRISFIPLTARLDARTRLRSDDLEIGAGMPLMKVRELTLGVQGGVFSNFNQLEIVTQHKFAHTDQQTLSGFPWIGFSAQHGGQQGRLVLDVSYVPLEIHRYAITYGAVRLMYTYFLTQKFGLGFAYLYRSFNVRSSSERGRREYRYQVNAPGIFLSYDW